MSRIRLSEGSIVDQEVDAIVNAANTSLVLGTGVAGAIRERGGPSIQECCNELGPIKVGSAAITGAGELCAQWILHAAVMEIGGAASEESVRSSLSSSLDLAREKRCRVVACPALGTGVGGLGMQRCAEISLEEASRHLAEDTSVDEIRFVLFGEPAFRIFEMVQDSASVAAQMKRLKND
jgi:O-acetyl-ADP-ribose deacetylase (regulator of RNase III)